MLWQLDLNYCCSSVHAWSGLVRATTCFSSASSARGYGGARACMQWFSCHSFSSASLVVIALVQPAVAAQLKPLLQQANARRFCGRVLVFTTHVFFILLHVSSYLQLYMCPPTLTTTSYYCCVFVYCYVVLVLLYADPV
jgi:hypothetical protein